MKKMSPPLPFHLMRLAIGNVLRPLTFLRLDFYYFIIHSLFLKQWLHEVSNNWKIKANWTISAGGKLKEMKRMYLCGDVCLTVWKVENKLPNQYPTSSPEKTRKWKFFIYYSWQQKGNISYLTLSFFLLPIPNQRHPSEWPMKDLLLVWSVGYTNMQCSVRRYVGKAKKEREQKQ